jgi:hypothetical protein
LKKGSNEGDKSQNDKANTRKDNRKWEVWVNWKEGKCRKKGL